MPYQRKTTDIYDIEGDYGQGFECVNTETTWLKAKKSVREYRQNEKGIAFRITKKRIKVEVFTNE